jgi:hypothetical protein
MTSLGVKSLHCWFRVRLERSAAITLSQDRQMLTSDCYLSVHISFAKEIYALVTTYYLMGRQS